MSLVWWHWMVLGFALLGAEILAPGFVLIWFGLGALLVGLLLAAVPELPPAWQIAAFAVASGAALVASRAWVRRHGQQPSEARLNRPDEGLVGQLFLLDEAIERGRGHLWVGDVRWRVLGPDLPAGRQVRVVGWDEPTGALKVEPAESAERN